SAAERHLHSVPTRRSSDLGSAPAVPGRPPHAASGRRRADRPDRAARPAAAFVRLARDVADDAALLADGDRGDAPRDVAAHLLDPDRKSTRLNSSHVATSYA